MASSRPPKGRRTSTGAREVHVTVTRDRRGRRQTRDTESGRYAKVRQEARRQAITLDRVDGRLKWGSQANGWWYIPPNAGGKYNWVRQQSKPTVIGGYLYKPGPWWPHTTRERPGNTDERGRPYAPYGAPAGSAVPWDVSVAAHTFGRAMDPSSKFERFKSRRTKALEYPTPRTKVRQVKPKKKGTTRA